MQILKYPNVALSTKCELVTLFDTELHNTLDAMVPLMLDNAGIGLAANQVGILKRFFIMKDSKGKVWDFINPKIIDQEGFIQLNEGCLSAKGVFVQVPRSQTVTIHAQDRFGEFFTVICNDLEAVCALHEIDHLDGEFFLSKTTRNQRRAAFRQLGIK